MKLNPSIKQRILIGCACLGVAFAYPLWQLFSFYDQHKPDAIRLFIPLIACAWLCIRARTLNLQNHTADHVIAFCCGFACCISIAFLYLLPAFSMRYWQFHWLLFPIFASGLIALLAGRPGIKLLYPIILFCLLLWPPLIHFVSYWFTPALLAITEGGCFLFIHVFDLPVHSPSDHILTCQTPNGPEQLRVGSPCSGINGFLALSICLIPLLVEGKINNERRLIIICSSFILLSILSILRLGILTWICCLSGTETAFEYFHLFGGSAFFFLLCFCILGLSIGLGLRIKIPEMDNQRATLPQQRFIEYIGFTIILCCGTLLLQDKPLITKPPTVMHQFDIEAYGHNMPVLSKFESWHVRSMDWTRPLFGAESSFDRFAFQQEERIIWLDSLLVDNFDKLELHNVFDCYRWHNYEILSQDFSHNLDDIPSRRYHYKDADGREWVSITWIESIDSQGQTWWQRLHAQIECSNNDNETFRDILEAFSIEFIEAR